jgi:hypothetical protein
MADYQINVMSINDRISKLQALEYTAWWLKKSCLIFVQ